MKKVAFLCCLFCGLITQAIGATYKCKPQYIGPLASRRSNEYLFMGESNYDDKIALVCGHKGTDGCEHGTIVMVDEWVYYHERTVFKGNGSILYGPRLYMCVTSGGSSWERLSISGLDECSGENFRDSGVVISFDDEDLDVRGSYAANNEDDGTSGYLLLQDLCKVAKKGSDSNGDSSPATSEEKKTDKTKDSEKKSEQDAKQNQSGDAEEKSKEKSAQDAKQNQSGDAEENEEDKWLEPCSPEDLKKVPHAKEGRYIYRTKDEIVCAATKCEDGYYLVRNAEGKSQGWCNYGTDPYATTNASETTSEQDASSSDASGAGASTQNQSGDARKNSEKESGQGAGQTQPGDAGEKSKEKPEQGAGQTQSGGGTAGQVQSTAAKVRALTQKIENAASQLNSISSKKFKVSEWKDAEGKFNTARLASDSIAGVVLGTAGGLITSHVVKKNQVENGFQDIKCTIGGQSVANWGDEFSVGIR